MGLSIQQSAETLMSRRTSEKEGYLSFTLTSLIYLGPPGPPDKVAVEEITDSTAQLSWTPGRDNGSPITGYIIQARTPFTVGWQAVDTGNTKHSCELFTY